MNADEICLAFPAREASLGPIPPGLAPAVVDRLRHAGITDLYSHQAAATAHTLAGRDVCVVTGTNSGKTLCYSVPILHRLLREPAARALLLFPTKALAQDQASRLKTLLGNDLTVGVYDGDTPKSQRAHIRRSANLVISNPDMLHAGILPGHSNWTAFFKNLRVIALDEMHVYRGVFGTHVAFILRRLLRLASWYGNAPQIVGCSATIANPEAHFAALTGRRAVVVDEDGSPQGRRFYRFLPPSPEAISPSTTVANLVTESIAAGQRVLCFNRSRLAAELVLRRVRAELTARQLDPALVDSYRGGYTPADRRKLERQFRQGGLRALISTSAMELGVDIGGLDTVILNGYPGTIASFRQQAGRAGRGTSDGHTVLVAHTDPLENLLTRAPGPLLESRGEAALINIQNAPIVSVQLAAAAAERPLEPTELMTFSPTALDEAERLERRGTLEFRGGRFLPAEVDSAGISANIRSSDGSEISLLVGSTEIGVMDAARARHALFEGAIYLHRGQSFLVVEDDRDFGYVTLQPTDAPFYTVPLVESRLESGAPLASDGPWSLQAIQVTERLVGYDRVPLESDGTRETVDLDGEPYSYGTTSVRFRPQPAVGLPMDAVVGAVHGVEHALRIVAPLVVGCDRGDLGSSWQLFGSLSGGPEVDLYDRAPGGVGLAEGLFARRTEWLRLALQLLQECPCPDGCPLCLMTAQCEIRNATLHKPGTIGCFQLAQSASEG